MAIYVRKEWLCQQTLLSFSEAEVTLLTIEKAQASYVIVAVYRPPGKNVLMFLQELEQLLIQLNKHENLILVGDFNVDISTPGKMGVSEYQTLISAFGLEHKIVGITREEVLGDKLTRSCIDHILTRIDEGQTLASIIKQKVADHYFVTLTVRMDHVDNTDGNKIKQVSILDNVKVDKLIAEEPWDNLIGLDHTKAYDELALKLQHIYKSSQRTVTIKQRKENKPWLTQGMMELSYLKERLYRRSKANPADEILKQESRQMSNKLTAKIRLAKNNYYKNKLNSYRKDIRKSWQLVNSLTGRKLKNGIDEVIMINFPERQTEELANEFKREREK